MQKQWTNRSKRGLIIVSLVVGILTVLAITIFRSNHGMYNVAVPPSWGPECPGDAGQISQILGFHDFEVRSFSGSGLEDRVARSCIIEMTTGNYDAWSVSLRVSVIDRRWRESDGFDILDSWEESKADKYFLTELEGFDSSICYSAFNTGSTGIRYPYARCRLYDANLMIIISFDSYIYNGQAVSAPEFGPEKRNIADIAEELGLMIQRQLRGE